MSLNTGQLYLLMIVFGRNEFPYLGSSTHNWHYTLDYDKNYIVYKSTQEIFMLLLKRDGLNYEDIYWWMEKACYCFGKDIYIFV